MCDFRGSDPWLAQEFFTWRVPGKSRIAAQRRTTCSRMEKRQMLERGEFLT